MEGARGDAALIFMARDSLKTLIKELEARILADEALEGHANANGQRIIHARDDGDCLLHSTIVGAAAGGFALRSNDVMDIRRGAADVLQQAAQHCDPGLRDHMRKLAVYVAIKGNYEDCDALILFAISYFLNIVLRVLHESGSVTTYDPREAAQIFGLLEQQAQQDSLTLSSRTSARPRHFNTCVAEEDFADFVACIDEDEVDFNSVELSGGGGSDSEDEASVPDMDGAAASPTRAQDNLTIAPQAPKRKPATVKRSGPAAKKQLLAGNTIEASFKKATIHKNQPKRRISILRQTIRSRNGPLSALPSTSYSFASAAVWSARPRIARAGSFITAQIQKPPDMGAFTGSHVCYRSTLAPNYGFTSK